VGEVATGLDRLADLAAFLQRYTPRRSRSKWSPINREKAERLIADGRMRPAGRPLRAPAMIERLYPGRLDR
jgi:uncharacterized protein YdeI (YjbR/CyaY-like superfamily)